MAVITENKFKDLLRNFRTNKNFYYNEPVDKLLGKSWTKSDLQNTMLKFTTYSEDFSAKAYLKEGVCWIKIYKGEDPVTENSSEIPAIPMRYFKKSVFYVFEYTGDTSILPKWITDGRQIIETNKSKGEFKLIIAEDDWFLIQADDIIVYDVDKNRFIIYDSLKEVNKLYISEEEIEKSVG